MWNYVILWQEKKNVNENLPTKVITHFLQANANTALTQLLSQSQLTGGAGEGGGRITRAWSGAKETGELQENSVWWETNSRAETRENFVGENNVSFLNEAQDF